MYDKSIINGIQRRDFLKLSGLAIGGLAFGNIFDVKASGVNLKNGRAKTVILVFLDGGPTQTDTFDPKPKAGKDYYGFYSQPIETKVPGIEICEKLPLLAKIADKYTIIRSMTHGSNAHEVANYIMGTGTAAGGGIAYPSYGAVISYLLEKKYSGDIPPYVSITGSSTRYNEVGFLSPQYRSFSTGGEPESKNFSVEGIINQEIKDIELQKKQDLMYHLDSLQTDIDMVGEIKNLKEFRERAYSLILGESRKTFEVNRESDQMRDKYGRNRFGQSCLLARRLAEYGVPFVTVRYGGWDTSHKDNYQRLNESLPVLDQGLSALLSDLSERGMLDQTMVICGGEFGRTPKILWEPPWNGGRSHFGTAFSYLVAGGGFEGGKVLGATDFKGETIIERPVYPWDFVATIYQQMGIDPKGTIMHPRLGEIPLLPDLGKGDKNKGILNEILL